MSRRKLAAGNWKMHGLGHDLAEVDGLLANEAWPSCDVLLCPPSPLIARLADRVRGRPVMVGGQDCHAAGSGAHTGDVSAAMLADAGASHVILGHSERRADHGETDAVVRAKAAAARRAGLVAILCVGEAEGERDAGTALDVVGGQLAGSLPEDADAEGLVVAYEPVWAIGTGRTPTVGQIGEIHTFLRERLGQRFGAAGDGIRLLYGGSVKAANAAEIFAIDAVDGALVGGASLKAADFAPIVSALEASAD